MARTKASLLLILTAALTVTALLCMPYTPKAVVRTVVLEEGELVQSVLLSGIVRYLQEQPCAALKDGRVKAVHAAAGEAVRAGQLLFQLDTSAEEAALAACVKARWQQSQLDEAMAAVTAQGQLELWQMEMELRAIIEASNVRAEADGVVGAVYVQEGDWVSAGALLGWMHSPIKCVQARGMPLSGALPGAAAVLDTGAAARLHMLSAPESDGMQQTVFLPVDAHALDGHSTGESVTVELLCATLPRSALVPLAAVSAQNEIWLVEGGIARARKVDISQRGVDYVAAPLELAGKRVILQPDGKRLTDGCAVKEAKAP